jgi:hypothetical protein
MSLERTKLTRLVDTRDIDGIARWVDEVVAAAKSTAVEEHLADVARVCGPPPRELRERIAHAINATSAENGSNTPDFILADYLADSLAAFDKAIKRRSEWYGHMDSPCSGGPGNREDG